MQLDLQIQIYMLAGVFGGVSILLIFIMAAICGKVEKLKRKLREREREWTNYDNYAFNYPTIQRGEELNRRGFTMHGYEPYNGSRPIKLVSQGGNMYGSGEQSAKQVSYARRPQSISTHSQNGDGTRDASSDFSAVINSETVVITTRDQNGNVNPQKRPVGNDMTTENANKE